MLHLLSIFYYNGFISNHIYMLQKEVKICVDSFVVKHYSYDIRCFNMKPKGGGTNG